MGQMFSTSWTQLKSLSNVPHAPDVMYTYTVYSTTYTNWTDMKYIKFQMYRGEGREETWFFFLTFKFMLCKKSFKNAGLGIRSLVFCANHSCFANNWANEPFAHFWWATWTICSHSSFLVSDLSDSLPSLIKKEGMSESQIFLNKKKLYKTY